MFAIPRVIRKSKGNSICFLNTRSRRITNRRKEGFDVPYEMTELVDEDLQLHNPALGASTTAVDQHYSDIVRLIPTPNVTIKMPCMITPCKSHVAKVLEPLTPHPSSDTISFPDLTGFP